MNSALEESFVATVVFANSDRHNNNNASTQDDADTPRERRSTRMANNNQVKPLSSVMEALQVFKTNRSWHKDGQNFHSAAFEKAAKEHAEEHNLSDRAPMKSKYCCTCGNAGKNAMVIEQVATYRDVTFVIDPVSLSVHSVINQRMTDTMIDLGYQLLFVNHHTCDDTLPTQKISKSNDPESSPAPTVLKVPSGESTEGKIPTFWKKEDETYSESLVRAFEEKFVAVDKKNNKPQAVYSPIWKWTKDVRAASKIKKDSNFTNLCKCYYVIREIRKETDPSAIHDSVTQLRNQGTANNPAIARGDPKVDWWEEAVAVAKRRLSPMT